MSIQIHAIHRPVEQTHNVEKVTNSQFAHVYLTILDLHQTVVQNVLAAPNVIFPNLVKTLDASILAKKILAHALTHDVL